jgi:hypothetical protein
MKTTYPAITVTTLVISLIFQFMLPAHAQEHSPDIQRAIDKLTGGSSHVWIYKRVVGHMGPENECKDDGKLYRFSSDKKLIVTKCQDGKKVKTAHTWAIEKESPLDTVIIVDGMDSYKLLFRDSGNRHFMILRTDVGGKGVQVQDEEFVLGGD